MITALVMMNVERHSIPTTAQAILDIPGVTEVYSVTGEYDLVAIVRTVEYDQLAEVVTQAFARVDTVTRTHTLMAFQCYSSRDMERMWSIGEEERDLAR
jgi:DNA-binding Lrp family transcriptional regulator